jgi:hypothetical protein
VFDKVVENCRKLLFSGGHAETKVRVIAFGFGFGLFPSSGFKFVTSVTTASISSPSVNIRIV